LHAKVFVAGDRAFIGSTNVSNHSAHGLIEAFVETDNRSVVASCREFVASLRGEPITPEYAKKMQAYYKPPKFGTPRGTRRKTNKASPLHSPLWIVPLVRGGWDPEDYAEEKKGLPQAKAKPRSSRRFFVEDFKWTRDSFLNRLQEGDLLIQALDEGNKRIMVSARSRVLKIRRYDKGRSKRAIIYLESPRNVRRKSLKTVTEQVGPHVKKICRGQSAKLLRDWWVVHPLLNLWPSVNGNEGDR
jgi:hypothetical protein